MSTCILVLGTPRSGTSCVAGILSNLGIFMGDNLIEADPMNPLGFFQDVEFEELFDDLDTWMPTNITMDKFHTRRKKLVALIQKRVNLNLDWGVKFKHAPFVVPLFESITPVKLIVTERNIHSSIASLNAWSEPHDQDPTQVINRATNRISQVVNETSSPILKVNFDNLLLNPEIEVKKIAGFIGRDSTPEAVEFVKPALKRY